MHATDKEVHAPQPVKVLILGDRNALAEALAQRLTLLGADVEAATGTDSEIGVVLKRTDWAGIVVLAREDALALRLTLLSAHLRPDLSLWVTLFDKTIMHRLHAIVPSVQVLAPAELVAHELADRCCVSLGLSASRIGGIRVVDDALRLMLYSGAGLATSLAVQTVASMVGMHYGLVNAVYFSSRSLATVSDIPRAAAAPDWFKLLSTATTIVSVALVAVFTAALVRRLSRPRLTTLFGRRRAVARGHALIVGFGQIGFRLAQELRRRGVSVVVLERNPDAPYVRLARRAGIPVAIGRGDDRAILEQLGVSKCAVVAAVTSDDLANVAIGLAAIDVRPGVPTVLRLGDGDVAAETESLLHLGSICDAHELVAQAIANAVVTGPQQP